MRRVRSVIPRALLALGLDAVARRLRHPSLTILCYHGVREDRSPSRHWLLIAQSELERQLLWLRASHDVRLIDDALARLHSGAADRPLAAVTFDDGYRSNLTLALPVLERLGLPASVYLTTGLVGTATLLWTTWLEVVLGALPEIPSWLAARHGLTSGRVKESLKGAGESEREEVLGRLRHEHGEDAVVRREVEAVAGDFAMMSWDDVRAAAASGLVTFGAHTVTHPVIAHLDDQALEREVGESMDVVAREVTALTHTFAYPNGRASDFDARAAGVIRRHGGIAGLSTIEGLNRRNADPFALRRIVVGSDDGEASVRLRASGMWKVAG